MAEYGEIIGGILAAVFMIGSAAKVFYDSYLKHKAESQNNEIRAQNDRLHADMLEKQAQQLESERNHNKALAERNADLEAKLLDRLNEYSEIYGKKTEIKIEKHKLQLELLDAHAKIEAQKKEIERLKNVNT